jgi:hypothetical protein
MTFEALTAVALAGLGGTALVFLWLKLNRRLKRTIACYFRAFPTRRTNYANYQRNYDLAVVGGSECVGSVDLTAVPDLIGFNWGLPRQGLRQDFWIVKNYFSLIRRGGNVLLFVSPRTLQTSEDQSGDMFRYSFFLDRNFLQLEARRGADVRDWLLGNVINYTRRDRIYETAGARFPLLYPLAAFRLLMEIRQERRRRCKTALSEQQMELVAQEVFSNRPAFDALESGEVESARRANTELLITIIAFLKERGLNPVIVVPPAPSAIARRYPVHSLNRNFYSFLSRASSANVTVLDYLQTGEFSSSSCYVDSTTLTPEARRLFTQKLLKDLASANANTGAELRAMKEQSASVKHSSIRC